MRQLQLLRTGLVATSVFVALLIAAMFLGQHYVELLLPLYRWEIAGLNPDYRIASLALINGQGEGLVQLKIEAAHQFLFAGKIIPAGTVFSSSTLLGHVVLHPLLMFSVLLAWPGISGRGRLALVVIALPWLALVEMLDVPLLLTGSITDLLLSQLAPYLASDSWIVHWTYFLESGGRLALSLAAALATLGCYRWVRARRFMLLRARRRFA